MSIVLATGGLGFIGSHTCLNLVSQGYDVIIVDSLINSDEQVYSKILHVVALGSNPNSGKIIFKKGDLLDKNFVEEVFRNNKIESVIHFAGLKSVEESVKNPLIYWFTNITITLNLISSMQKYKCYKLVFSSSATIYKPLKSEKLNESFETNPINPYGNTKLTIEKILEDVYKSEKSKWKIINLRYFNPVGAHPSGLIGESPKQNSSNLFPILGKVIFDELDKVSIFGNNWPTKDGTCIRDYIHIIDLAEAHVASLRFLENSKTNFLSINIGTGIGSSVLDVINTYNRVNKVKIPFKFENRRKGDVPYLVADNKLSLKLLNWYPKKSLELMCQDSFNFLKKRYE